MQCPNCSAQLEDSAKECSSCSLVLAKWQAKPAAALGSGPGRRKESAVSWMSLALILALGGGAGWAVVSRRAEAPVEADVVSKFGARLDPNEYRTRIMAIEALLYKEVSFSLGDLRVMDKELAALVEDLERNRGKTAQSAVFGLRELYKPVHAATFRGDPSSSERIAWVASWERVRGGAFEDADFFRRF